MCKRNPLSLAILTASVAGFSINGVAEIIALEEITVTATKRAASLQDVPIAVQALGGEAIEEQNVGNFDDYLALLPNVTAGGRGPGQSAIYIRGIATDASSVLNGEVAGLAPNVALYLDEQPVGTPARNLDVYITDVERIEVLAGPQGTLFGASSQAGTVRIITNKPHFDGVEAGLDASVSSTRGGEMSNSVEGFINIPLIEDKLAVRAAFYSVQDGGYIDNKEATFKLPSSNPSFPTGATIQEVSNAAFAEEDYNDSSYKGFRGSVKYNLNEDWSLLAQHMVQEMTADGVFDYDPEVGELEVARNYTDAMTDEFSQTSVTIEGRLGTLDLLYTGSYLDRETEQRTDNTAYYNVGQWVPYYICDYPNYTVCGDPTYGYNGFIENTRTTHEFRVNTDPEKSLRLTAGVFYDDMELLADTYWDQPGLSAGDFYPNTPLTGATAVNPNPRPQGVTYINDFTRTEEQAAVFGELTYDLTDALSVTMGARYYEMEVGLAGSSSFNFRYGYEAGRNMDEKLRGKSPAETSDTIYKLNVSYAPNDDILLYGTYSEGFRPGGFNRDGGSVGAAGTSSDGIVVPDGYESDTVKNYEFGWKATLLEGSMQFNGALYFIDWSEMQVAVYNLDLSRLTNTFNVGEAEVRGVEADITWQATENLRLFSAFSFNDTELTSRPDWATNMAEEGSQLAMTPELQVNVRARYEWDLRDYPAYWQLSGKYADDSYSSLLEANRFKQEGYVTLQGAVGVQTENWGAELFVENLTDKRAELYISEQDYSRRIMTNRPRTIGLRVSYDF